MLNRLDIADVGEEGRVLVSIGDVVAAVAPVVDAVHTPSPDRTGLVVLLGVHRRESLDTKLPELPADLAPMAVLHVPSRPGRARSFEFSSFRKAEEENAGEQSASDDRGLEP
jgi:hypothetical protein